MPRTALKPKLPALPAHDPLARFKDGAVIKGCEQPIPLQSTKIAVRIRGGIAIVETTRVFRNDETRSIEATLTFPVPVHATLVALRAVVDGRALVGAAKRREAAREDYEAAVDAGKTAALHEEVLRGVHMLSVTHLPPGKEVSVMSAWAMPLTRAGDAASLRIPTTIGDIYGRSPLADSDDLVHAGIVQEAELEVDCDHGSVHLLGGGLAKNHAKLRLDAPIDLTVSGWRPRALKGRSADGRAVELTVAPAAKGKAALDVDVFIDHSGSMTEAASGDGSRFEAGSKHDVTVAGLRAAAQDVGPKDSVRLWEFANMTHRVDGASFAAAIERLSPPSGGTEMGAALAEGAQTEGRDVLVVTDGKTYALDVQALARSGKRFTVVLVGEDALDANVGHLAALTGGQLFIVAGSDAGDAVRQAIASLRAPYERTAPIKGDLKVLETLVGGMQVKAIWGDAPKAAKPAKVWKAKKAKAAPQDEDEALVVGALAAALALPRLPEDRATDLAQAHGIVCHLTSLILVDEAGEAQEGVPAQRKIPLMTPRTLLMVKRAHVGPMRFGAAASLHASASGPRALMSAGAGPSLGILREAAWSGDAGDEVGDVHTFPGEVYSERPADAVAGGPGFESRIFGPRTPRSPRRGGRPSAPIYDGSLPAIHPVLPADPMSPADPSIPTIPSPFPTLPAVGRRPPMTLRGAVGKVDWTANPEALRQGRVNGLDVAIAFALMSASSAPEVAALAKASGATALTVAVALLAKADSADRAAARVFRAVLGKADPKLVAEAMIALGL